MSYENKQTIFYSIFDLIPGIYEIHSTGEATKYFGHVLVSDTYKLYDYETKQPYSENDLINIGHWENENYNQCFYVKIN